MAYLFAGAWAEAQQEVWETAEEKGWHQREREPPELLCLIHSEVSEVLEAFRSGNPASDQCQGLSEAEVELADVVIRIMDMAQGMGLNVAGAIVAKMEHNKSRPVRHGGKIY